MMIPFGLRYKTEEWFEAHGISLSEEEKRVLKGYQDRKREPSMEDIFDVSVTIKNKRTVYPEITVISSGEEVVLEIKWINNFGDVAHRGIKNLMVGDTISWRKAKVIIDD